MKHRFFHTALALAAVLPSVVLAQPKVDIQLARMADAATQILLIPSGDFNEVFSSIVFTLAWDSTEVTLEPVFRQTNEVRTFIPVSGSGVAFAVGGMKYQKYVGVGLTPLAHMDQSMLAGKSFQLGWLESPGGGSFRIADDPWLAERRQNGAYHVSLNGLDRTGKIIGTGSGSTLPDHVQVSISPNPYNEGPLRYEVMTPKEGMLTITVSDARGRTLSTHTTFAPVGRSNGVVAEIHNISSGSYTIQISINEHTSTVPLIVGGK